MALLEELRFGRKHPLWHATCVRFGMPPRHLPVN
jgi:hypothetical protein